MWRVTKQGNQSTLLKSALSQSPEQAIIVTTKVKANPSIDLYKNIASSAVIYDATNDRTKCYLPYNDVSSLHQLLLLRVIPVVVRLLNQALLSHQNVVQIQMAQIHPALSLSSLSLTKI